MNKTAIRAFARTARGQLIQGVRLRAMEYGITEQGMSPVVSRVGLTSREETQLGQLLDEIRCKGYAQVMEEAACGWFSRFIGLRFMEVNGFLPSGVRVFSDEQGRFDPAILGDAGSPEQEGLYRSLLIALCNDLSGPLPELFGNNAGWMELLLPRGLLDPEGVVGQLVSRIPEEDWLDAVQIIGWLYQSYNSQLKDDTFALLKKNVKISKERIPAATQLFTPDWIVGYLVENSLGRLYVDAVLPENLTEAQRLEAEKEIAAAMGWHYFLPEPEQASTVRRHRRRSLDLQQIKIIDPCMGSGHILVYAFHVLMQIYTARGWSEGDAAKSILENNLYGLDLDDRVAGLGSFALMMKARKYHPDLLSSGIRPNLLAIQDSGFLTDECIAELAPDRQTREDLRLLRDTFRDAKDYGSLIKVPILNLDALCRDDTGPLQLLVRQAKILAQKYDVVITNPPYMGKKSLNSKLSAFLDAHYPTGKSELYSAFICQCSHMTKPGGFTAMVTIHTWMFIRSFEALRRKLLETSTLFSMMHTGAATFEELNSFNVLATAFVLGKGRIPDYRSAFLRLAHYYQPEEKRRNFDNPQCRYDLCQQEFLRIPGAPFVYWISGTAVRNFDRFSQLRSYAQPKQGLATGDNDRFVRFWHEVSFERIGFGCADGEQAAASGQKWFPYNKGGDFRKWYGMNEYVIDWEADGNRLRAFPGAVLRNPGCYFRRGITWSLFGFENFGVRYKTQGFLFDVSGSSLFPGEDELFYILAFLAGKVAFHYLSVLAPTVNFQVGNIGDLPLCIDGERKEKISQISRETVELAKEDWDDFETSWDFQHHPLV